MTTISVDSACYCNGTEVAKALAEGLEYEYIGENEIIASASEASNVSVADLQRLLYGPGKLFDGIKEDRPRQAAALRVAMAKLCARDGLVVEGRLGYLIPSTLTNVLKVGLVGARSYRLEQGIKDGLPKKKAEQTIRQHDESRAIWAELVLGFEAWDKRFFDMLLPVDQLTISEIISLIIENSGKPAVQTTEQSLASLRDFQLASTLQLTYAELGHDVDVVAQNGIVEILIKKHTLFLARLKTQLVDIAKSKPGVAEASARPGPRYQEARILRNIRSELPSKVLLVDDEKAFVQTLSRRLKTRDINSSVAYGGSEALDKVRQDEPEVIVLDLKMPGVDGLEVLRRVKDTNSQTEVIILTAHGSEAEERLVFQLGAFAYLRKPVDIDELTQTMQKAYRKVRQNQE